MKSKINVIKMLILYFVLIFMPIGLFNSCSKKDIDKIEVNAEKTDIKTYEIISLNAKGNLLDKYKATFGDSAIELYKTSDSTLTFYVPDVAEGDYYLDFDLAKILFKVTKTQEVDASNLVTSISQTFISRVNALYPTTAEEIAEVSSMNNFKREVISLFLSLSSKQKRETALFYEANKDVFKSFSSNVYTNLNASSLFKDQSNCPRTNFRIFYGCTADNLGLAAIDLKNSSREFLKMLLLAGASAYLAPASFGLSATGTILALGTAGYLYIIEVRPALYKFKKSLYPFIGANWILTKAIFSAKKQDFTNNINSDLQLNATLHSIGNNDAYVGVETSNFINSLNLLNKYWVRLTEVFGSTPAYANTEEPITLLTQDISLTNISNPNVQLVSQQGEQVKFKSLSGNSETFNYHIKVSKQGFVEEKDIMNARLLVNHLLEVGDSYQGGIIGYILQVGDPGYNENYQHGLIVAEYETTSQWGCDFTDIVGTSDAIGTGKANTTKIINGNRCSGFFAADECDDYNNGYFDWYLPSSGELSKLWSNMDVIGGFGQAAYWSSTQSSSRYAMWVSFHLFSYDGNPNKDWNLGVRPIRSF